MTAVNNIKNARDELKFVLEHIINVIMNDPSSKDNVVNELQSGELKTASEPEPFIFKSLGISSNRTTL